MTKTSKMMQLVNCRLRITLQDGRVMVGQLLAYDKHMNLVLTDCEEFRRTKSRPKQPTQDDDSAVEAATRTVTNELRRTLGMVILRGETIVSMVPEGGVAPSASGNKARIPASMQMAPGSVRAAVGRGVGMPPPGPPPIMMMMPGQTPLAGPVPGMYVRPGMPMPPPGAMPMQSPPPPGA